MLHHLGCHHQPLQPGHEQLLHPWTSEHLAPVCWEDTPQTSRHPGELDRHGDDDGDGDEDDDDVVVVDGDDDDDDEDDDDDDDEKEEVGGFVIFFHLLGRHYIVIEVQECRRTGKGKLW